MHLRPLLRQALAADAAFQRGASKEEVNAAAEAARAPKELTEASVCDFKGDIDESDGDTKEMSHTNATAFLEWSLLPISEYIQVLDDGTTFYALPAFAEFAEATQIDKTELIAEFEDLTGLSSTRETLRNGRHKGYKK